MTTGEPRPCPKCGGLDGVHRMGANPCPEVAYLYEPPTGPFPAPPPPAEGSARAPVATIWSANGIPDAVRNAIVGLIMAVDGSGAGTWSADVARDRLIAVLRVAPGAALEPGRLAEALDALRVAVISQSDATLRATVFAALRALGRMP